MKRLSKFLVSVVMVLLLIACGGNNTEEPNKETTENEIPEENTIEDDEDEDINDVGEDTTETENDTASEPAGEGTPIEEDDLLAEYSAEEIEYARVWLEIQGFTDMDQLNVRFTQAGTPVHPQIEEITEMEAPVYPEDVIQLSGNAGVHGMVTYSGNGDGTINVYNIPYRLPYPEDENWEELVEMYEGWIENPELVQVDVHDDEDVIELIEKIHYLD